MNKTCVSLALCAVACTSNDTGLMGDVAGIDCTYDRSLPVTVFQCRTEYNACYNTCVYDARATVYAHSWMGADECFERWVYVFVPPQDVTLTACVPTWTLAPGQRPNVWATPHQTIDRAMTF